MKTEAEPISDDEWLLRRVHKMRFRTEKVPLISPTAFEPRLKGRDPDTDGISLYRAECLESVEESLETIDADKRGEHGIVRVQVKTLRAMGLDVSPIPDSRVKGHVVIPGLNSTDYAAAKAKFTPTLLSLAKAASDEENIVLRPRDSS